MSEYDIETLSQFVQRVMRQKSLSPREVQIRASAKGQIAASYISRITTGKVTNLSVDKVVILAEGLGVNPFEVFAASYAAQSLSGSNIDSPRLLDTMQKAVSNLASLEVLEGWLRLSPENQSKVRKLIKKLSPKPGSKKQ